MHHIITSGVIDVKLFAKWLLTALLPPGPRTALIGPSSMSRQQFVTKIEAPG